MAKTISLVLGSGGARGLVHVGIIRWLIEHGYQIQSISGCSIGALIGGVYAAGKLDEFEEWVTSIDQTDMAMSLPSTTLSPSGRPSGPARPRRFGPSRFAS